MPYETLICEKQEHIATVTMNRPDKLNAFNAQMSAEFRAVFEEIDSDDDVYVVILTGAGRAFSSGADIRQNFQRTVDAKRAGMGGNVTHRLPRYPTGVTNLTAVRQPIIAAINGHAIGMGFNYALQCDIRIASDQARIRLPFTALGQTPEAFSTYYLPRLIGIGRALELWYTARVVTATEALELGLVNRVVPHAELMSAVREMARLIAVNAPTALRLTKRIAYLNMNTSVELARNIEMFSQDYTYGRKDFAEAVQAFQEKRSPRFTGE